MINHHPAHQLATAIADQLHHPSTIAGLVQAGHWHPQSLSYGVPGITLLHIELAAAGLRPWQRVHDWLTSVPNYVTGQGSEPYYGAPAFAHTIASAAQAMPNSYQRALSNLDAVIEADVQARVAAAHTRISEGQLPALGEFDAIRGLTGYGAYLLRRDPVGKAALRAILSYLVRLTHPLVVDGEKLPGWWAAGAPTKRLAGQFPNGHANNGVAHGITGPLALLSLATLRGVEVDDQRWAITEICAWLDRWECTNSAGPAWPYWITHTGLRQGTKTRPVAQRPSWCYGTIGIGRAQQLAALVLNDRARKARAETAVTQSLTDPAHHILTTENSLCHGLSGLAHLATVIAADALPEIAHRLRSLIPGLLDRIQPPSEDPQTTAARLLSTAGPGLLEGAAGIALAGLGCIGLPPRSGWNTCLLIA